jgi:UDP-3-O-[3-hydroxymyristoyl] glucosamine N-acyltransferase
MGAEYSLAELAARCGGEVRGDAALRVRSVATIQNAAAGSIVFLANPHYRRFLTDTRASAVILAPADADACALPMLVTPNPYLLYAKVATLLAPPQVLQHGVHAAAHVSSGARIAPDAWVGPGAVVETGAIVDAHAQIGPNCVVMEGARVGDHSRLVAGVTLCAGVQLGKRGLLHPGVVIGADGFGMARDGAVWVKVPQLGSVQIGDDVEIGANTTIDRGALDDTVIEDGVKLDNQIQIGHNTRIGAHTAIAGCTGIAGSVVVGKRCMIAGGAAIAGHIEVCDDVVITAYTLVSHSIEKPGVYSGSLPMDEAAQWRKNSVRFRQLDKLARRVADLEKKTGD